MDELENGRSRSETDSSGLMRVITSWKWRFQLQVSSKARKQVIISRFSQNGKEQAVGRENDGKKASCRWQELGASRLVLK